MALSRVARAACGPAALALVLAAVPVLGGDYRAYQLGLYLLYGMVAQGIALTWGRAGFLSLGQSLFFGLAAYLSAHVLKAAQAHPWMLALFPLVASVPGVLAYVIGRLVFAKRQDSGPYFSLITLALVMLAAQVATQWSSVTGGFNGLGDVPELPALGRYDDLYWLIAGVCVAVTATFAWLWRTPLGSLWQAVGQNENRLQFFGFATDRLKALAFAISAFSAGLAGALYAPQQGLVTPQAVGVTLSTELVIWTAVGGRRSPYGALLGAVVIGFASAELRERFAYWEAMVAMIFIGVVLRYPGGLASAVGEGASRVRKCWYRFRDGRLGRRSRAAPTVAGLRRDAPGVRSPRDAATLAFSDAAVRLNDVQILSGLSLRIDSVGVHCVIGPNGAGKTSTFNVLTGRLPLSSGDIRLGASSVVGVRADRMARLGVGRKFQIPSIFSGMTVRDNLAIAMWANRGSGLQLLSNESRLWHSELRHVLEAEFPFLVDCAHQNAGELSQGQRQMLELVMTVLPEPRLLLLDEPCAGLSPHETKRQMAVIAMAVAKLGATALVIEHDMAAVEMLADKVHVLHQGRLLASGSLKEIQVNADVQMVYAGGRK